MAKSPIVARMAANTRETTGVTLWTTEHWTELAEKYRAWVWDSLRLEMLFTLSQADKVSALLNAALVAGLNFNETAACYNTSMGCCTITQ